MFKISEIKRDLTHKTRSHQHPSGQLFLVHQGAFVFENPKGRWLIPSQNAGWIPPHHPHSGESFGSLQVTSLYVDEKLCESLPTQPCIFAPSELLSCLVQEVRKWPVSEQPWRQRQCHIGQVILDELFEIQSSELYIPFPADKHLRPIAMQLIQNPSLDDSLDHWAQQANLSRRSFTRHFKQATGLSFVQWLCHVKILKACEYLAQGQSVTEVAFTLGFNQVSSFNSLFKKHLAITPNHFKAQCAPNSPTQ